MQNTILRKLVNINTYIFFFAMDSLKIYSYYSVEKKDIEKLNQVNCENDIDLEVFFWNTIQIHTGLLWLLRLKPATLAILLEVKSWKPFPASAEDPGLFRTCSLTSQSHSAIIRKLIWIKKNFGISIQGVLYIQNSLVLQSCVVEVKIPKRTKAGKNK